MSSLADVRDWISQYRPVRQEDQILPVSTRQEPLAEPPLDVGPDPRPRSKVCITFKLPEEDETVQDPGGQAANTVAMLGRAYSLLGFQIVDGVVGAGFPQKPSHSAVFAQIRPEGSRLTALARAANMTPQAMGQLVDELEELDYVERQPDPTDRRAKLIVLTPRGQECVAAGIATIEAIEARIDELLGADGHAELRRLLSELLSAG